jgi:predicted enzyme related to lactoylglutathione lyase
MAEATVRGHFVWHDLLTPNPAGAHEFYGKVLGWKQEAWEQDASYLMFAAPGGPIGGTVEARAQTPHWLPYIATTDLDAAVDTGTRLGGRVLRPAESLPNGGRYATLADPQGASFGLYASKDSTGSDRAPQVGEFSWHELATTVAPSVAFPFYAELFGWDEISQHDMGQMGMYLVFGRNGRQLGGVFDKSSQGGPGSAYWLGYVSVKDLEGTVERAKSARGSLLTGPMDVPGGDRIAQLMDPHGAFFALHMAATASQTPTARAPAARAKTRKPAKAAATKQTTARKQSAAKKPQPKKPQSKKRPAKKAAAKNNKPVARKAAKSKSPAKKATPRKPAKKAKAKAKTRKRGR